MLSNQLLPLAPSTMATLHLMAIVQNGTAEMLKDVNGEGNDPADDDIGD